MAYELREGQGNLFHNKYKKAGDNQPGLKGTCKINGQEYEIAVWKKQGKDGKPPFYSVQVQIAGQRQGRQQEAQRPTQQQDFDEDLNW